MSWVYGIDVTGRRLADMGWVMGQILWAINEREQYLGQPPTEWTELGAFPVRGLLDEIVLGHNEVMTKFGMFGTLVGEARTAIETISIEHDYVDSEVPLILSGGITKSDYTYYSSFSDFYNTIMGSGTGWQTPVSEIRLADPFVYEELMRLIEACTHFRVHGTPWNIPMHFNMPVNEPFDKYVQGNGGGATTDAAWTDIPPLSYETGLWPYSIQLSYYDPPNPYKYRITAELPQFHRLILSSWDEDVEPEEVLLTWGGEASESGIFGTVQNHTLYLRSSSSDEAGPGVEDTPSWTPTGDELDAISITEEGSFTFAEVDVTSCVAFGTDAWFRIDAGTSNPFSSSDPERSEYLRQCNMARYATLKYKQTSWLHG